MRAAPKSKNGNHNGARNKASDKAEPIVCAMNKNPSAKMHSPAMNSGFASNRMPTLSVSFFFASVNHSSSGISDKYNKKEVMPLRHHLFFVSNRYATE